VLKLELKGRDRGMAELIAYAIAGHHAGLPDMSGETSGLADRLKKIVPPLDTIWRNEVELDPTGLAPASLKPRAKIGGFQIAFLGRMIFSCLVDADFLDTEAFYASVDGRQVERGWPVLSDEIERMIALCVPKTPSGFIE
jgi:CRISPR-associated endonuclease/helicase Cas3